VILASAIDGPEEAPTLVLAGSLGTDKEMWRPQVEALGDAWRLVRLDVRGHGDSPVPDGPYTIAALGQDVLDTMDALAIERAAFCGLSIGGMIGQWLGAHAPERIEALVLLFTAAVAPDPDVFSERAEVVRAAGGAAGIVEALLPRWLTTDYRAAHPETVAWLSAMVTRCPAEGYAASAEAIAAMDLRSEHARIAAPTLVLGGAQDGSLPPEYARAIAEAIPGARFELLDPAGHLASIERADTVNALIAQHVAGRS
jgi:3-oxoadipate enol-lactonase